MPTVPQYQRQSQSQAAPVMVSNLRVPENPVPAALQGLAQDAVNIYGQEKRKADVALSQDAMLQFQQHADDLMNNPQTGLITKQGKAALGQSDSIVTGLEQKAQELAATVPEGEARDNLMRQLQTSALSYRNQARQYEVGQFKQYETNQFGALQQNIVSTAQGQYGDPAAFTTTVKTGFDAIDQFADAHGWSDEERAATKVKLKEQSADGALAAAASQNTMDFISSNGEPGDHDGAVRVNAHGNSSPARGIRNNNPGNIEAGNTPWEGQDGSDGRFAKFITPEHGIRALGKNLLSYADKGYDTVTEIVNRWAPASDGNNTDAYIKSLCSRLGVKPDDQLNMSDINTLKSLCAGIVQHENGKLPYSDDQLNTGVQAALGLTALETPKRYTGNAAFDAASPQSQAAYLRQAKSVQDQMRTQARAQLTDVVQDATASYLKGVEYPNAPTEGQFVQAYGYREGRQRYEDLSNMRVAGQYIGSFRNMPTSSITQYVADLKNQLGEGEGFAGRSAAFDHVQAAANRVISLRESDPYQAALDMGAFNPIASNNPNDIAAEVKSRFASSDKLKAIGINAPLLSKQEAAGLSDMVRGSTNIDQSINLLQNFGRSLPPQALRSVAGSIAPNSAATAYASLLLAPEDNQYNNQQPTIAYSQFIKYKPTMDKYEATKTILLGDQLVNPTDAQKKAGMQAVALPSDDKLRQEFDDAVGTAFQYNPQARQMAYSVFKSAYAGLAYTSKDTDDLSTKSVNSDLAEKAVQYATGGVYQGFNGGDVVMPFGMDKSTFKDRYNGAARDALSGAGLNPGAVSNFRPVNVGDNQYRLVAGSGRWAVDPRTGNPIIVRVQ